MRRTDQGADDLQLPAARRPLFRLKGLMPSVPGIAHSPCGQDPPRDREREGCRRVPKPGQPRHQSPFVRYRFEDF